MFLDFLRLLIKPLLNSHGTATNEINVTGATELDDAIPEHWSTRIRLNAFRKAFWGKRFEGKEGSGAPIIMNTDFIKMAGDVIHFQLMRRLLQGGVTGNSTLTGNEEKLSLGQYDLTVDWLRNAVGFNKRGTKRANFGAVSQAGRELTRWMATQVDDEMNKNLVLDNSPDVLYAGGKSSEDALDATSIFDTDVIDRLKLALERKGAIPFDVRNTKGEEVLEFYGVAIAPIDAYNLRGDDQWNLAQKDAMPRGMSNPIFTGALGIWNGVIIFKQDAIRKIQGTFLRPEATLSANVAASGAVTVTVTINSNTSIPATKMFASTGKIQIGDEVMTYTSKTDTTFVVGAGGRGALSTSSVAHTTGDFVTQRNISSQIAFGSEIAVRGWGKFPVQVKEVQDYGFKFGVGVEAVFGQTVVVDTDSSVPNYLLSKSYAKNPNPSI